MLKMKLGFRDRSDWVWYVIKTKQYNEVTYRIGVVYVENDEFS